MAASGFLESFSPWTSRTNTPKPEPGKGGAPITPESVGKQQGGDHSVDHRHRFGPRDYPQDCPVLNVRWYYAVDVPKRKPLALGHPPADAKPPQPPKKFVPFSVHDSRSIESAFQKLADEETTANAQDHSSGDIGAAHSGRSGNSSSAGSKKNSSIDNSSSTEQGGKIKVPVNEDFLYDVDIQNRELAPAYWLGAIYDVRRGSWFYQEGSVLRPCDENLATQLEEGYLKVKPWRYSEPGLQRSLSGTRSRPTSLQAGGELKVLGKEDSPKLARRSSLDDMKDKAAEEYADSAGKGTPPKFQLQALRLFGNHMDSMVTFQDATTAWVVSDDFLSRMSSTVYQRFKGGGHLGGAKVIRGYLEVKSKESKADDVDGKTKFDNPIGSKERTINTSKEGVPMSDTDKAYHHEPAPEPEKITLERQVSNLEDPSQQEEEVRRRDEKEIQDDYKVAEGDEQGREIEHLILVTHGIGQRLGLKLEGVNFIHDVNVLRKTLKGVYENSPDLQALNSEIDKIPKNCRLQVLPVVWRHLLDFPRHSVRQNRKEQDLTDADEADEEEYPSLQDITVEGVPFVRNIIADLGLDILLYQSAYRDHISGIVQRECNRVYELFVQRNPSFKGKISLLGHSLGSAILFDILCYQKEAPRSKTLGRHKRQARSAGNTAGFANPLGLHFDVEDFYCLGSPLGLFQMLKGRTIAGRQIHAGSAENPPDLDAMEDPFLGPSSARHSRPSTTESSNFLGVSVSSPKCSQLFNIFHPADPIAYRIEPLISPAMSSLKPQPLPYIKKGIFGAQGQGFTGIGALVGQSVSGFWSNITSGVASSLLNRSLGITGDGQIAPTQSISAAQTAPRETEMSAGAGTNTDRSGVVPPSGQGEAHPSTLIDSEMETLFAGFEKRRKSQQSDGLEASPEWLEAEERAKRFRKEEAKVRALNSHGRVDYSIKEGVLDFNLYNSIASHLSYWSDEDVSHFMISQLLSRQRVVRH